MASFSRYALTPVDAALLAWLPPSTPPPAPDARCCAAFRQGVFAASIHDPDLLCALLAGAPGAALSLAGGTLWAHSPCSPR